MTNRLSRLRIGAFTRDTAVLAAGTAAAQAVALIGLPLLSRLHAPEAFGRLAVFTAVASISSTLITLRYEAAAMLPKDADESRTLTALSFRLALGLGLVLTAVMLLPFSWPWAALTDLGPWLAGGVIVGIGTAWLAVCNVALGRQRDYRRLAIARVGQSALFLAAALALVGIPAGLMLAHGLAVTIVAVMLVSRLSRPFTKAGNWTLTGVARTHASAPTFLLPTALLDTFSNQLPVLVIASQWGNDPAGQFGMAWRILAIPATLIGSAVAQVFYQRAAIDAHGDVKSLRRRFLKVSLGLGGIALPAAAMVAAWGDRLFPWAFGAVWADAGSISQWLVFSMAMYFVFSPTSTILVVLGHQRLLLLSSVVQLLYRIGIALAADSVMQYIRWLVVVECVNVVVFVTIVYLAMQNRLRLDATRGAQ